MSVQHNFTVTPPPRYPPETDPWTAAKFESSTAEDGTFTLYETVALSPIDTDPENPAERLLTSETSDLESGWFRIYFVDADGIRSAATAPMLSPSSATVWRPSVADVAALIRARTKVAGGLEVGTFQDAAEGVAPTRPNATEVERLIDQAVRRVASRIGGPTLCDDASDLEDDASSAAALYAAMLVEQSYYPEQTTTAGSSFQSLRSLWADTIADLAEAVEQKCGTGSGGNAGGGGNLRPRAMFDDVELIGRLGPVW